MGTPEPRPRDARTVPWRGAQNPDARLGRPFLGGHETRVLPTRSRTGDMLGARARRAPGSRRRQRLSWQCRNCTEALKTGRRRKLKRAGSRGAAGGKATEASAGQPPRRSARAGPSAGRDDGVTEQRCSTRPQRADGRASAACGRRRGGVTRPVHLRCNPPGPPAPAPHLHEHAAVGRDLQRARAAREGLGAVRQLQTEKGPAEPGPRRREERGC